MLIGVAAALLLVVVPLMLGLAGVLRRHRAHEDEVRQGAHWSARLTVSSALLYALAFNLTFLIQELFLVLPKALLPGVRPTLFRPLTLLVGLLLLFQLLLRPGIRL